MVELRAGLWAHASGAAWLAESRTLLAADLHLGYAWAQRRQGELGPIVPGAAPEQALVEVMEELAPQRLVIAGDLVHAPRPSAHEVAAVHKAIYELGRRAALVIVAGNHDRGIERDFGFAVVDAWREGEFLAAHGHERPRDAAEFHCLYGHWHPAVGLHDHAGARIRYRAFLHSPQATVLPAFSPFSRGLNAAKPWPADLREALGPGPTRMAITTGRQIRVLTRRRG